jgi:multidrug efflux pump subunit AcrA (membrane-fusion protein)
MRHAKLRHTVCLLAGAALTVPAAGCSQAEAVRIENANGPAVARVEVVKPIRATVRRSIEVPGQIEAYEVTPIHAKISGYVHKWNVDIGAKVKKGQVLAVLSDPELDAEAEQKLATVEETEAKLAQAKASEQVAQANLVCAQAKLTEVHAGTKRADADPPGGRPSSNVSSCSSRNAR